MRLGLLILCLALMLDRGSAQAAPETLQARLIERGYTDVGVSEASETLRVSFTSQAHQRLAVALGEVLALAVQGSPLAKQICLLPQFERLSIGRIEVNVDAFQRWSAGQLGDADFLAGMKIVREEAVLPERQASSRWLVDLGLTPAYSQEGGLGFGLQAGLHVGLGDGCAFYGSAQQTFFHWGNPMPGIPLANLVLSRWWGMSPSVTRIGYFGRYGWGAQTELGIPLWHSELRLLGGKAVQGDLTASARLYARVGLLNLGLRGGIGRYLDGDWGYEFSVMRWFERSSLEGTILKTTHGLDIRAVLSLALGGEQRPDPGSLRIEPGVWPIVYQAGHNDLGRTLNATDDLETFHQRLYRDEIGSVLPTWPKVLE